MSPIRVLPGMLVVLLAGCTTTLVPPADPPDPVPVFLLDHGRTSSLVLPSDDGLVRYAYGDWNWYALGQTGVMEGAAALLWSTDATLGRRFLDAEPSPTAVRQRVAVGIERVHTLMVASEAAQRLHHRLDQRYRAGRAEQVVSPASDLSFVPDPADYHLLHNSNHATARWLEAMGVEARGSAMVSDWRVAEPAPRR